MEQGLPGISDEMLVTNSLQGDRKSLEELIGRYSALVHNLAFKMGLNKEDAADSSQEIFIKLITKLDSFKHHSSFKTWLYRIAVNHLLNVKRSAVKRKFTFDQFGQTLEAAPDLDFDAGEYYEADQLLLVEETKQTCMSGMLLCLDKKHRMVFILGELLGVKDQMGSEVLGISPENFRMILSRGKRDLYNFMHDKCGLINKNNPCRCAKKTKAFIKAGFVDPRNLRFAGGHRKKVEDLAGEKQEAMEDMLYGEYRDLYLQHALVEGPDLVGSLQQLLASEKMDQLFHLNKNKRS
jgi:RNA polymerase sigma factor (sigma-70 family)